MREQVIDVPGYLDFLVVDGDGVWGTNKGSVELWTRAGKQAEVAVSGPCGAMAIWAGSLWVANCKESNLYRIDVASGRVVARIATGIAAPDGELNVVAGADAIWIASDRKGEVARVDPNTDSVTAHVIVAPGTAYLAWGMGKVWAVSSEARLLQRIDPVTNAVTGTATLVGQPGFLAAGEGAVWVQEQADGTVARVDPETMAVTGRTKVGETLKWGDIDTGAGAVWLRTTEDQTFVKLDSRSGAILGRYGKAAGSGALRFTPQGLWTTAHDVKRLSWWPLDRP